MKHETPVGVCPEVNSITGLACQRGDGHDGYHVNPRGDHWRECDTPTCYLPNGHTGDHRHTDIPVRSPAKPRVPRDHWVTDDVAAALESAAAAIAQSRIDDEIRRSEQFRKKADDLYDLRGWLRLCADTPEGHAEFYKEACLLIFGEYRGQAEEDCAE